MASPDRLFTPRFFMMCGFTFTVFLSAFQLLPTAPFHILDLGGTTFASGLFLGFLTYSSALSAPLTGAYADRIGQRRVLIVTSLALALFSVAYAVITDYRLMLALAIVQGDLLVWTAVGLGGVHDPHAARAAARRRHRLLGVVDDGGDRRGADDRVLGLPLRLGVAVRHRRRAEPRHGGESPGACDEHPAFESEGVDDRRGLLEWRVLVDVADTVPLFVRLRRHHELHRDVRRRERHDAERDLPDGAGDRRAAAPGPSPDGSATAGATGACSFPAW